MADLPNQPARLLRMIAVLKWLKSAGLVAIGIGLLHPHQRDLASGIAHALRSPLLDRAFSTLIDHLAALTPAMRGLIDVGTFLYAAIFAIEGVGLWRRKRWAEWMTVLTTSLLIPLEIYEIFVRISWERITLLVINLTIVLYLVARIRRDSHRMADADLS